jgi:hypothetical protein
LLTACSLVTVAVLTSYGCGSGATDKLHGSSQRGQPDLADLAGRLQQQTEFSFPTLDVLSENLTDVADRSTVVGSGQLVDIRDGYQVDQGQFADGTIDYADHMLLVIRPDLVTKGQEHLGSSGLVYVDESRAPYIDPTELAAGLGDEDHQVGFFLTPVIFPPPNGNLVNEYQGRSDDDPIYWPTTPSTLIAIDSNADVGFPLLTDENMAESSGNLSAMQQVGEPVDTLTAVEPQSGGVPNG